MADNAHSADFQPITLQNALSVVRPQLGGDIPIALFRLVRLVLMEDLFGHAADAPSYMAGKQMGLNLGLKDMNAFLELCKALKIGLIEISDAEGDRLHVDVHECVTCSGLTPVGRPLCAFEGGLIAGVLEGIRGGKVRAREVTCIGGLGDASCGFDITFG
ncbi:MAG TPA: V4R domain-containing protein [Rhodocyclaceae bacterium]